MPGTSGPFQVIEQEGFGVVDDPVAPPRRRFCCTHYETCLNLAAALNWDNFTCRGCCGEVNDSLLWRARQALKKDVMVRRLCEIPEIPTICGSEERPRLKVVAK